MTTTTPVAALDTRPAATGRRHSLRTTTLAVGVGAALGVTALAAALDAAGVPFAIDGEAIPLAGFAQMTLLGAIIGGVLVAVLNRRSSAPRRRFVEIAVILTAASCIPSVALPPDTATKLALVATHVVAAALIVPVLARHAHD